MLVILTIQLPLKAQYFELNGNAKRIKDSTFELTPAKAKQAGAVWYQHLIDLRCDFDLYGEIYLGDDNKGGDGIAFVMNPKNKQLGSIGSGMGYSDINPSIAIEFDTYQNKGDPNYDHIAYVVDGYSDHQLYSHFMVGGFAEILDNKANAEDNKFHDFRIYWDAKQQILNTYIDQKLKQSTPVLLRNNIFPNDTFVYWGFTSSTGDNFNKQIVIFDSIYFCGIGGSKFPDNNNNPFSKNCKITCITKSGFCGLCADNLQPIDVEVPLNSTTASILWSNGRTTAKTTFSNLSPGSWIFVTVQDSGQTCSDSTRMYSSQPYIQFPDTLWIPGCQKSTMSVTTNKYFKYLWSDGDTVNFNNLPEGKHHITVYDEYLCFDSDTFEIVKPKDFTAKIDTVIANSCIGINNGYVKFSFNGNPGDIYRISWSHDDFLKETEAKNVPAGSHSVQIFNQYYCVKSLFFNIIPKYQVELNQPNVQTAGCPGDSLGIIYLSHKTGLSPFKFSLQDSTGKMLDTFNEVSQITELKKGKYVVIATDLNGCKDTVRADITETEPYIYLSNTFTPDNNDQLNDYFEIPIMCYDFFHFQVYSRWGIKLFETTDPDISWNGWNENTGIEVPSGTYFYILDYRLINQDSNKTIHGSINLIRPLK